MHHDPIATFQIAQQRHHADLRSAELRRSVRRASARSTEGPRRTWVAGFTGRAPAARLVEAGPRVELRHAR
jgi:hypothetical protein